MPLFITSPPPSPGPEDEDFWANDGRSSIVKGDGKKKGESMSSDKQPEQRKGKGKEKMTSDRTDDSDELGNESMDLDPKLLEVLDTAEKEAYDRMLAHSPSSALVSGSGSSDRPRSSTVALPSTGRNIAQGIEIINIEDDDENEDAEDKENVPVPKRHVRRRTEDDGRGGLDARVLSGSQRARDPGRPTILAKTASAVIDLSDSD